MPQNKKNISNYLTAMILIMGSFSVMGGGLIAPALPSIGAAFGAPSHRWGLILSVYTFSAALSLPFTGYFIDLAGRRKVALTCLLIDGTAGLAVIIAPSFRIMLILRFIQGIGIAGLMPSAMTIIGDLFEGEKKLGVIAYLSATISLAAIIIPALGGLLASIDWRLVFAVYSLSFFLAGFFFFTLPETMTSTEEQKKENRSPLKYISALYSALKIKSIRQVIMHSMIIYFLLYALITFLPIYLIVERGFDEIFTGIALSLQGIFGALLASRAKILAKKLHWKKIAALGFALIALSFALLPLWPGGNYLVSISFIIYGAGMGIVSPAIYNRITELPPKELAGSVIAIFNTMKYVGMTLSPFILGYIFIFTELNFIFLGLALATALWAFHLIA